MANYFYVKSGLGTRTTDTTFTAAETGAFGSGNLTAANVYANIGDALGVTTKPTDGDFILASDDHAASYDNGGPLVFNDAGSLDAIGLTVISVDNDNCENYLPGASDKLIDNSDDIQVKYNVAIYGMTMGSNDNAFHAVAHGSFLQMVDSTITVTSSGDYAVMATSDGVSYRFTNVDIDLSEAGNCFQIKQGSTLVWNGGALLTTSPASFVDAFGSNGSGEFIINGVDLSIYTGTLFSAPTSAAKAFMKLTNCLINSSVTPVGTLVRQTHRFEMYGCDNSTDDKLYRFWVEDGLGSAKNNNSVYVTATEAWYGGSDKSSIQVETKANCSATIPFVFELPAQYVDLSSGSSDKIEIEMWSETTLTAGDICAFLVYPDGTTAVQANWVSSGPSVGAGNYGHDPLSTANINKSAAGAGAANLGASDWTGESGTPLYYTLELDTSGDAGAASAVSVRIEVYKASITDPIYIHPLFTLS